MPTQNNHSSAIAVSSAGEAAQTRSRHIFGISLGATLLTVLILLAVIALAPADASAANTCTLTSTAPTTNWTDTTKWSGCGGSYPGAASGDTAIVGLNGFNLNVDTIIANGVILQMSGTSVNVMIPSGSALQLQPSSSSTSTNTISINGGQLAVGSGTVTWGGNLIHNTGTLALTGTLVNTSGGGTFTINGGFINGPGTLQFASSTIVGITGSGGGINVDGATIDNLGSINDSVASPNTLSLLNGAKIKLESGSVFSISSDGSIQTNNTGSPSISILSGGALSKGTSAGTVQIDAIVNNGGSVTLTSGTLNLYGGGTHSGSFSTGTGGTVMGFNGAHTLGAGTSAAGGGVFSLVGGTFTVNTTSGSPWTPSLFNQSGGTVGGTGTMRITSTFNWTGGTQGSAGTTDLTGTTNVNGSSVTLDSGRAMTNSGTFNYIPNGASFLTIDGSAHIDNSGTINLQNDAQIASSTPSTSYILTNGTGFFKKTVGSTSIINCSLRLNGAGTLQPAASTTISLNGGTGTGNFGGSTAVIDLTGAGSEVYLAGGNFSFAAGSGGIAVNGNGELRLANAVLQLTSGPLVVNNFFQDGAGLLQSTGPGISINGAGGSYTWDGGTVDGNSAGGDVITVNGPSGTLNLTGGTAMTLQGTAHLKNAGGNINFNPVSSLAVNSGAVIDNSSGTFTFNNNNSFGITTDNFSNPLFTNNGSVTKANNSNTIPISLKFNHNTTMTVNGGTLQLLGGGTSAGAMTINSASARVEVAGGQYFMSSGATVGGSGTFAVTNGATLSNNTTLNVNNFELNSATVNGGGGLTINSGFKWLGGTFSGTGSATISPGVITDATAPASTLRFSDGFIFINNGTFNYNPLFNLSFENNGGGGVSFTNNASGVFDLKGDGTTSVTGSGNSFSNFGTLKKSSGTGIFTFNVRVANGGSGIIDEQSAGGTIAFSGSGNTMSGGQIKASSGTGNIDYTGGDVTYSGGTFAGPGAIELKGGIFTVSTAMTAPPIFNMSAGSLSGTQTIDIPSGAAFNWSGGSITGSGGSAITVLSGGAMNAVTTTSSLIYDTRPLVINSGGNFNWNSGANAIIFQSGAPVSVAGGFNVATNGTIGNLTAGSLSVTGVFQHTVPGTLNISAPLNVQSGGTLTSSGGGDIVLLGTAGVSHAGTFDAQASSFINFAAATHQFNSGAGFSAGTGGYKVTGATLSLNTNVSAPNFALFSGSIAGGGNLGVTTNFGWSGGSMSGAGTTTISGTGSLTSGPLTLNRNLVIGGNTTMNAASGLSVQTTATITNNATFIVQNGDVLCSACTTASFANNGTIQKNAASTTNWSVPITGAGSLSATAGTFADQAPATFGTATINNAIADFSGSPISIGSVSGSAPLLLVSGGATTVTGTTTLSGGTSLIRITGGSLTLNGTASTDGVQMTGGTLNGSGTLTASTLSSVWSGGTMSGSGNVVFNAPLAIDGASGAMVLARNLTNNSTITYNPPNGTQALTVSAPAAITNGGTFNFTGGFDLLASGAPVFTNSGVLTRTAGSSNAINFGPAVVNAGGTSTWSIGTTTFTNGYSQTAGTTTLTSATIGSSVPFNFTGGAVFAKGTVNGSVIINGATFNPGNSPGAIAITGDYTQSSSGILNSELNGTVAGTSYDQVNVGGNVNLNGTLNASVGYTPSNNDVYDIITFTGTRTGDFSTYNLPPFGAGGSLQSAYVSGTPNKLRLTAIVTQFADLSITNTASANPVNAGAPLSFVLNVSNAGPDPTTGTLTVSNTVPSGVTAATGSGPGWSCGALSGSVITCTSTTSIASSGSAPSLTITMNAPGSGPATDSASVSSGTADPNSGNNTASQSVTVNAQADVSITKNTSSAGIAGQNMVYTIVVTNNGPSTANAVSVADPTPSGLTFVSNSGACTSAYPCALGNLTSGQNATITSTYTIAPGAAGSVITNSATVSSTTTDPSAGNNTAVKTTSITGSADLTITKSGPASSTAGSTLTYTITVTNNGPSDATVVSVSDATPANTTFTSNAGACTTAFPCALGTMTAGQSKTITSTFTVSPTFTGATIANSATVTSATSDPNAGNNTATATTSFGSGADLAITKSGPTSATTGSTVTYTLTITNTGPGAAANVSVFDATPSGLSFIATGGGCTSAFPCALGTLASGQSVSIIASYTVTAASGSITNTAQVTGSTVDGNPANDSSSVTTSIGTNACGQQPPSLVAPANGATITSPVTFSWTAVSGATGYKVFASIDGASTQEIGSTSATSFALPIASGTVTWSVQALGVPNCTQLNSATRTFSVCSLDAPVIAVVGTNTSSQTYTVSWTALPAITSYELQEAATAAFDNPASFTVTGTSRTFTKNATTPTAFFYRVRALGGCSQSGGPFSASERVVIVPIPPINSQDNSATVDINNKKIVVQSVFIPGQGPATPYSAATDEPWLTVSPATGILLPQGITLTVSADPADLPNGTFTATIILTLGSSAKLGALDAKPTVSVPVSVSVVTPVSPANLSTPPANSLIIPSVGHLDGINSQWRSDVRITNTAQQKINYLLRFTPAGGDPSQIKQTQISIAANDTTALDDIVKNWYGVGALGDAANGVLEVRPLNTSGKGAPNAEDVSVSLVTVASSRTFNQSAGGTLGQYIPAIPFANFIGKVISGDARAGILSMQQIAQSAAYRTNLGIVEAAGKPASVLISVFDAAGKNLLDLPIDLKAGEQQQLNSFLGTKGITLTDGRIEVKVTGGDGKVIAYASVVDNKTTDPLLVTGTPLAQTPARSYVLPGVADLSNGSANWRSDLRVFNAGTDPQYVTMTLYPQTGSTSSDPISRSVAINPGEITILDNILSSRFGLTNIGGALHVDTLTDANLVVTGRTYNQIEGGGTYGQFIAAVTPADAVGKGGRTLNVLQVEDSTRYRTNLGIAEVSGKPATVEVSVLLPDAKVAPKLQIPLAANEYRQFRVLQQLGVGTAYNARITIRVIDGDGRIAAYGSVVDMQTQDPTYVPAQ